MAESNYAKTSRNSVNRHRERGRYDYQTVHSIIDTVPVLHVSFVPKDEEEGFPVILPMIGCTGNFATRYLPNSHELEPGNDGPGAFPAEDDPAAADPGLSDGPRAIYVHGYVSARMFRQSTDSDGAPRPAPVSVAATHLDGVLLALSPFSHSCNYRSAVVHGLATLVTDAEEKDYAMQLITDNMVAARWANTRTPPTKAELQSTSILRVDVVAASAKIRVGGPSDDRNDLKDPNVIGKVWAGILPTYLQYGEPIGSTYNQVNRVPWHVEQWRKKMNAEAKEYAERAAREEKK